MFRYFNSELKRMLTSKYLLFGFAVASIGSIINVCIHLHLVLSGYDVYMPVFIKWVGYSCIDLGVIIFQWLFPLSVTIPFAWSMRDEMNSGYINHVLTRVKKINYFITKFLVSFISGVVVAAGTMIVNFMALSCFQKAVYPAPTDEQTGIGPRHFMSELCYENPYLYVLLWMLTLAAFGGVVACLSMALSFFIKKKLLVIISAQIIFIVQDAYASSQYSDHWFTMMQAECATKDLEIFKLMLILLIIEILITAVMGKFYDGV